MTNAAERNTVDPQTLFCKTGSSILKGKSVYESDVFILP